MSIDHLLAISWQVSRVLAVKYITYVHRNFIKDSRRALSSRSLFEQLSLCGWCHRDELLSWMRMLMRTYTMFFFSKGDPYQAQRQLLTIPLRDNSGCTIEVVAPFMVLKDINFLTIHSPVWSCCFSTFVPLEKQLSTTERHVHLIHDFQRPLNQLQANLHCFWVWFCPPQKQHFPLHWLACRDKYWKSPRQEGAESFAQNSMYAVLHRGGEGCCLQSVRFLPSKEGYLYKWEVWQFTYENNHVCHYIFAEFRFQNHKFLELCVYAISFFIHFANNGITVRPPLNGQSPTKIVS